MHNRKTPIVEEILTDSESEGLNTLKPEYRSISPKKLLSTIQERLNGILDTYESKRAKNPNEYTGLFKTGYSHSQKRIAIRTFRSLLSGKVNLMTDNHINALRDGHLGKALRAETHRLANRANNKEIGSIHEMVAYLQYHFFEEGPIADKLKQEQMKKYTDLSTTVSKMMK